MNISHADRLLVKSALAKINAGQTPSAREASAVKRVEKAQEEARRWDYYRNVPQKHYKEMSGRQARVLIDQASTWKIPCSGKVIDVTAVVKWLHDFIADNSHRLVADDAKRTAEDDSLIRVRTASARKLEMDVGKVEGALLERELVERVMGEFAGRCVQVMSLVENSVAAQLAEWMADPKVRDMPADERNRMARTFVAKTCREVRNIEAKDLLKKVDEALAGKDQDPDVEEDD